MISFRFRRAGRDEGGMPFGWMVVFSAVMHIALLSLFVFSTRVPSPKWTFGPVHSVQLVSLSGQAPTGTAGSSFSRKILEPPPATSAIILRKPLETTSAVPLKKQEVMKRETPDLERALEAIRERIHSQPRTLPATSRQVPEAEAQAGKAGQSDVDQRMDPYYAEIWARVRGQWAMPQGILPKGDMENVVNARILRNGAVVDVIFEKRSGNRYFDDSAVRAVKKASPLPPLPSWIRGESIEIGIRFRASELR
jgi:TonB family protein